MSTEDIPESEPYERSNKAEMGKDSFACDVALL